MLEQNTATCIVTEHFVIFYAGDES